MRTINGCWERPWLGIFVHSLYPDGLEARVLLAGLRGFCRGVPCCAPIGGAGVFRVAVFGLGSVAIGLPHSPRRYQCQGLRQYFCVTPMVACPESKSDRNGPPPPVSNGVDWTHHKSNHPTDKDDPKRYLSTRKPYA